MRRRRPSCSFRNILRVRVLIKHLEIYNGTGAAVNLGTGGYNIFMSFNGGTFAFTINLSGTVANGDVYVVARLMQTLTILALADQTAGTSWFNGDDAVVLRKGTTVIDAFGQVGVDPGTQWGSGWRRKMTLCVALDTVCSGDTNLLTPLMPLSNGKSLHRYLWRAWLTYSQLRRPEDAAPEVDSTYPVDGATDFPCRANLTVTFSEPVNLTSTWFDLTCSTSGSIVLPYTADQAVLPSTPVNLVNGESCTLTIYAANVTDQDNNDPPDNMVPDFTVGFTPYDVCAQPYTAIPAIQGSGATVALTGTRTTQGVVVGDYEGASPALRGFFIQDPAGDGDPATSDGIFVFEGSNANTVSLGDVVRVTGTAGENQGQSQISVGTIVKCGTGTVTPTDVTFPVASADFLERYEGMLVRLPQTMYVTEHFQLGRFGQVVLSVGGRLQQPTNVVAPVRLRSPCRPEQPEQDHPG